jgi:hypothetical protein
VKDHYSLTCFYLIESIRLDKTKNKQKYFKNPGTDNTGLQVSSNCQIFPIKPIHYGKVVKVENQLEKFDSLVQLYVLLTVSATVKASEKSNSTIYSSRGLLCCQGQKKE